MSDFGLQLDLGFLTKNRQYTFFKPKVCIVTSENRMLLSRRGLCLSGRGKSGLVVTAVV